MGGGSSKNLTAQKDVSRKGADQSKARKIDGKANSNSSAVSQPQKHMTPSPKAQNAAVVPLKAQKNPVPSIVAPAARPSRTVPTHPAPVSAPQSQASGRSKLEEQEDLSVDNVLAQQYKAYEEQQNRLKSEQGENEAAIPPAQATQKPQSKPSNDTDDPESASLAQLEMQQYKAYAAAQEKAAAAGNRHSPSGAAARHSPQKPDARGSKGAAKKDVRFSPDSGTQEERNMISCVIPGKLYLTNFRGAGRVEELEALGVKHIVCVNEQENDHPDRFNYFNIDNLEDQEDHDATQHFSSVVKFTDQALAQGGAVCFHCAAGISRSSTMVIAYLMASRRMSLIDAFTLTYKARRVTWPNRTFMMQLMDYERQLQSKGRLPGRTPSITIEMWDSWNCAADEQVSKEASLSERTASLRGRDTLQFRAYQESVRRNISNFKQP